MHVSGIEENFKSVIHCTCSKNIDKKYRQSVCSAVCYFAVNIRYFSTIVSLFGAGAAPFFTAPAPAPSKPFRRLRLRLRLRPKCVGSGGSGSGSGSGSASLIRTKFILLKKTLNSRGQTMFWPPLNRPVYLYLFIYHNVH